jgi:hypothetical protein
MNFNNLNLSKVVVPDKQKVLKLVGTDGNAFAVMITGIVIFTIVAVMTVYILKGSKNG